MRDWIERAFIWGGGALFTGSLALTGWRYLGPFGQAAVGPDSRAVMVDALLLSLFAVHHSLFARSRLKTVVSRVLPARLVRSSYVWVASLLLIGVCIWWQTIGGVLYQCSGMAAAPFIVVQLLGLMLIVRAIGAISALELAGIAPARPHDDDLQVSGPYRLIRHPLYLGWILAVSAPSYMTGDRLVFALVTTTYIALAIPWEERGLIAQFGDTYARYRARVRWRLVPFVY